MSQRVASNYKELQGISEGVGDSTQHDCDMMPPICSYAKTLSADNESPPE
jgi:hypothetical protein